MLEFLRQQLQRLLEERAALRSELDQVLEAPTTEKRALTAEEDTLFEQKRAAVVAQDEKIEQTRTRIGELEEDERRQANVDQLAAELGQTGQQRSPARVGAEPAVYQRGGRNSYFRDVVRAQMFGNQESIERLSRNDREVRDQFTRLRNGDPSVLTHADSAAGRQVRALSTTDGGIGEFVPPLWLIEEFIQLARAGRVLADQLRSQPLPPGTDVINLPRLATGTAVAEQATQNTAVQNTDATSNSVAANVATLAGQQVVSLQLIEQSPLNLDDILLADLAADYATKVDVYCISNNAAGKLGVLSVSGTNAVTYTDASPTVAELYPKGADAIQQVATNRFLPAQKVFMHPRRWAWHTAAVDTAGRPLVLPAANVPQNVLAAMGDVVAEGFVGMYQGLPCYQDPNIPINLGAGTNEDRIITARTDDIILFEGTPRAESFRETKADQLSVLLRFYNYVALHSARYPKSISVISGTGLVTPTF